ncbi:Uma2 family endonuclease [Microcoleus sp. LEGE 07076]|uniref:Uma2 family endonuclease n=1 Tax=Microcoleus sp. LEGE 07076 TaxID=915322 RepID=UPI001D14C809|nr:Uma2 family endonuclease [Microcoleus sp. LEGE 07076]
MYRLLPIGAIEGLLVGWGEAEPLDLRYQAEPGNEEWRVCWWVGARRSLWICVTRQSLGTREVPDRFNLPPDWIVEVLSPEQKPNKVIGNILYCLNFGSRLGWFLDPDDRSILVFVPEQQPRLYLGNEVLPVLEGIPLRLTVEQVYGWLKMQ